MLFVGKESIDSEEVFFEHQDYGVLVISENIPKDREKEIIDNYSEYHEDKKSQRLAQAKKQNTDSQLKIL